MLQTGAIFWKRLRSLSGGGRDVANRDIMDKDGTDVLSNGASRSGSVAALAFRRSLALRYEDSDRTNPKDAGGAAPLGTCYGRPLP